MGTKQLAELAGKTLIERAVETVLRAGVRDIVVVVGHQADSVAAAVQRLQRVRVLVNSDYGSGMASSIKVGIGAIGEEADGVLLVLVDQPLVTASLLRRMLVVFEKKRGEKPIVAAAFRDVVTPPAIFSKEYLGELLRLRGDKGARSVIARHKATLYTEKVGSKAVLADVDTREDLALAQESLF